MGKTYYSVYKNSNGDVGIGTTAPTAQSNYRFLQVNGSASAVIEATVGGTRIGGFDSASSVLYVGTIGSYPVVFRTAVDEKMRISSNGNVGIGTSSPSAKLELYDGNFKISDGNRIIFGTSDPQIYGNSGVLTFRTNSSDRMYLDTNGNVGIGITSPSRKLDVNGDANIGTNLVVGSGIYNANYYAGSSTATYFKNSVGNDTLTILQGGNVGIGTTSPVSKLHVVGEGDTVTLQKSNNVPALAFLGTSTNKSVIEGGDNFNFYTGGSSRFYIKNDGNVGIGTTSAAYKLQVNGTAFATTFSGNSITDGYITLNNGDLLFAADGGGDGFQMDYYQTKMYIGNNAGSTWHMVIQDNGNIGIGTTSPAAKLHIEGNDIRLNTEGSYAEKSLYFRYSDNAKIMSDSYLTFLTSGTPAERMRITSVGNVGIGTTTVRGLLHVSGDIIRDTNLPYSWGTSAPHRTFAGAYSYANGGVNGVARYLLLWPQITNVNGQNGRFVNARLVVSRGASHAFNDPIIGDIVASAGYNSSANLYSYTPLIGSQLYFYNIVYNGTTYLAISLPISDFRWELTGYYGIEETAYYSPTFVYANTSGVGTITQLTDYTNESAAIYNKGGNIGIGTTSPAYKLDVNGSINTNTFMYVSYPYGNAYPLQISANNFLKADDYYYGMLIRSGDVNYISGRFQINGGSNKRVEVSGYEETIGYLPVVIPGGNVGIGTTSPTNKLEVDGGSSAVTLRVSTTNTGAGVASLILANSSKTANNDGVKISHGAGYTNITDLNSTNIMTWDMSNTRVGIGTTSPSTPLHVFNTAATLATFTRDLATDVGFSIGADSNGTIFSTAGAHAYLFYTNGTEKVRITSDGNLGIGTTSVSSKLQIGNGTSNTYSSVAQLSGDSGGASTLIALSLVNSRGAVTGNGVGIDFHNAGNYSATGRISVVQAGSVTTDSEMQFFVYNDSITQRMVLNYLGNLGIGTTSPITKLHVAGTTSIIPTYDSGSGYSYFLRMGYDTSGSYDYTIKRNGTTGFLEFNGTQGSPYVSYVFAGGDVYSGASGGTIGGFYFNSSSHGIRRATGTNDVYCFTTSGTLYLGAGGSSTTHVRVLSGGDVGIGVSPSYKLDVNGNIHGTGFPTSSDVRFKKNITPLQNSLEKIKKLQGVKYEWNEFVNSRRDGYKLNIPIIGLIAQDVEQIVPEIVDHWKLSEDCQDARSIDYPRLIPLLIEAMKEQQNQIEELRNEIKSLKSN